MRHGSSQDLPAQPLLRGSPLQGEAGDSLLVEGILHLECGSQLDELIVPQLLMAIQVIAAGFRMLIFAACLWIRLLTALVQVTIDTPAGHTGATPFAAWRMHAA